ncbi:uncharacterized protein LOC105221665 [Zeugodacus cucurbitae]|uniref:uncharacterized protein LOC105221665 n=1 Tax=Zeugodacus cucurbitae TaxID=28588 RepID=UPI0023D8F5D1|nr:uncharacterized protein LOC105221665 [Zeugodacus cucurbitae]
MAPWNWRNPCTSATTDSDESTQTPPPTRKRAQNDNTLSAIQNKSCKQSDRCAQSDTGTGNNSNQNQKKSATPILFSTNRGLYLRVPKSMSRSCITTGECIHGGGTCTRNPTQDMTDGTLVSNGGSDFSLPSKGAYETHFCDLERWSTKRANTICLEDTFIVSQHNNLHSLIEPPGEKNNVFTNKIQRSGSIFCVPSGSRHALVIPHRSLYQRSTSIQSTFERFGVQ